MRKWMGMVAACGCLAACGTGVKQLGAAAPNVTPSGQARGCTNLNNDDHYAVTANFPTGLAIPTKVSITIDGVEKVNECKALSDGYPPKVAIQRFSLSQLVIGADYVNVRTVLPASIHVIIADLENCGNAQKVIGDFPNTAMNFHPENYGAGCDSHEAAQVSVQVPLPAKASPAHRR